MANDGDRTRFWPAIEKKYGEPMQHWFDLLAPLAGAKYQQQIDLLREGHGFSQAHANAVVMYVRGSASSRRVSSVEDYVAGLSPQAGETVQRILAAATGAYTDLVLVIAWNQPMARYQGSYVFGVSAATNHLLLAPWGAGVLDGLRPRLEAHGYTVLKKTVRVPNDWHVDTALIRDMLAASISAAAD